MAELFGRVTGVSHGRGGSMHLFAPEIGLMGTSGIVGGRASCMAAGAGYAFKLLKTDRVAVAFFGDGAVNNGAFHEGLNMAAVWKLPVLFVCENNLYATEVPFAERRRQPERRRARPRLTACPACAVDGNDVLAVYEAAGEAVRGRAPARARPCSSAGPTARGRTPKGCAIPAIARAEEVADWKARCPIKRLRDEAARTASGDGRPSWTPSTRRCRRWSPRPSLLPRAAPGPSRHGRPSTSTATS